MKRIKKTNANGFLSATCFHVFSSGLSNAEVLVLEFSFSTSPAIIGNVLKRMRGKRRGKIERERERKDREREERGERKRVLSDLLMLSLSNKRVGKIRQWVRHERSE